MIEESPLKVVPIHEKNISLQDIPAMLRNLAHGIEMGEYPDVEAVLVLMPVDGSYPRVFGFGDMTGTNEPMIQMDLAKAWMLNNLVVHS